jgi:hypothetical protein
MPANCGLLGRLWEISRLGRMRGGPGSCATVEAAQWLARRCGLLSLFEAKRLFSPRPAPAATTERALTLTTPHSKLAHRWIPFHWNWPGPSAPQSAKSNSENVAMSTKQPAADKKPTTVVANDPKDLHGRSKRIGGSQSDHWNNILANRDASDEFFDHTRSTTWSLSLCALRTGSR